MNKTRDKTGGSSEWMTPGHAISGAPAFLELDPDLAFSTSFNVPIRDSSSQVLNLQENEASDGDDLAASERAKAEEPRSSYEEFRKELGLE